MAKPSWSLDPLDEAPEVVSEDSPPKPPPPVFELSSWERYQNTERNMNTRRMWRMLSILFGG